MIDVSDSICIQISQGDFHKMLFFELACALVLIMYEQNLHFSNNVYLVNGCFLFLRYDKY